MLLDEPFSRLDKPLRAAFRTLVFERLRTQAIPALLVTHDEEDAPGTILQLIPQPAPKRSTTLFDRHLIPVIRRPSPHSPAPCAGPG